MKSKKNDHPDSFVASVVEIWGFGVSQFYSAKLKVKIISNLFHLFRHAQQGNEARSNQKKTRKIREINMNNRRQVDKSKFLDGFTQEYLLSNTYKHKVEVENR